MRHVYLLHLNWPEKCFRADAGAVALLRRFVPAGSRIIRATDDASFLRALPQATHALVWSFDPAWFVRAPRLQVLATPAAGRELVPSAAPRGIRVHFGHFHGAAMAETVVAFVLAWARGILAIERQEGAKERLWPRTWLSERCRDVSGSKAVVVGYGQVGRAIGAKLAALGVEVFGYSRRLKIPRTTLNARLRKADWLILALPSDTGTDNFVDAPLLALLPRTCALVNVGRGNAVDETALFAALREGRLAAACLDVRKTEPNRVPPPALDNLFLLPHASAFTPDYMCRFFEELKNDGYI